MRGFVVRLALDRLRHGTSASSGRPIKQSGTARAPVIIGVSGSSSAARRPYLNPSSGRPVWLNISASQRCASACRSDWQAR